MEKTQFLLNEAAKPLREFETTKSPLDTTNFVVSDRRAGRKRSNVTAMQSLLLDKKGANRLFLTLAGAERVFQDEKERPLYSKRWTDADPARACRTVAWYGCAVAHELSSSIVSYRRGDTQSHCIAGPDVECFDEPQREQPRFGQLHHDNHGENLRGASSPP
jgi:hypothetical protein